MPYRHMHFYLLGLIALTALAFWPNYFSVLPGASRSVHIHGATASLWIVLLAAQSWTIHHDRTGWHRATGIASLALFPLFFAGSVLIVHVMALKFASGDVFDSQFGARFAADVPRVALNHENPLGHPLQHHLVALDAEFLRQPDRLAATVHEDFAGAHDWSIPDGDTFGKCLLHARPVAADEVEEAPGDLAEGAVLDGLDELCEYVCAGVDDF